MFCIELRGQSVVNSYKGNGILTHDRKTTKEIPEDFLDIPERLISEMRVLVNGTFRSAFLLIGM